MIETVFGDVPAMFAIAALIFGAFCFFVGYIYGDGFSDRKK